MEVLKEKKEVKKEVVKKPTSLKEAMTEFQRMNVKASGFYQSTF